VHAGEIVGIAGLIGSGRTELLEAMYGARTSASGSIELQGAPAILDSPSAARKTGVSLVPESRKEQAIIPSFSISDTIALGSLDGGILTSKRSLESESKHAENVIRSLSVRCRGPLQPIGELSGGNQQKVVLAKSLSTRPRLLLLDEPTRGVDVGARREIYSILFDLAERGMAILVVSSEMEEVMGIADRILVMSEGAIMGELTRSQFSEHAIMSMASPHSRDAA
jgi:ribose transport system ATP-binding protein